MSNYRFIFKLEIISGLALIPKEVECDYYEAKEGTYIFHSRNKNYCEGILGRYPIINTIIHSINENPDYVDPRDVAEDDDFYGML